MEWIAGLNCIPHPHFFIFWQTFLLAIYIFFRNLFLLSICNPSCNTRHVFFFFAIFPPFLYWRPHYPFKDTKIICYKIQFHQLEFQGCWWNCKREPFALLRCLPQNSISTTGTYQQQQYQLEFKLVLPSLSHRKDGIFKGNDFRGGWGCVWYHVDIWNIW